MRTFQYLSIQVEYSSSEGSYSVQDQMTGREIGYCGLIDGPGWVYKPTTFAALMEFELFSITQLIMDLNSTLSS